MTSTKNLLSKRGKHNLLTKGSLKNLNNQKEDQNLISVCFFDFFGQIKLKEITLILFILGDKEFNELLINDGYSTFCDPGPDLF